MYHLVKTIVHPVSRAAAKILRPKECTLSFPLHGCIEKCMKFINKNAYIQTAIFGYHFCKAAKCAFFLILRNIARIMALSIVSGFVLLLGKLVITAGATFLCYVCLAYTPVSDELNYIWLPLVFTAIIAFYVAAMFNEVWGMAMSTILQCFCADEEIYKGDKDAMYAGADLKATVSNSNKGKFAKKSKVAAAPAEDEGDAVNLGRFPCVRGALDDF